MSGTLPPGGSSMPPSKQVKKIASPSVDYRKPNTPPTVGGQSSPVPGSNLPKNATRKPPTTGRGPAKPAA
jgi:hypothetical protein